MIQRKVLFLAADEVEDLELFYPFYRLQEAGFLPVLASSRRGLVTGKRGYSMQAELSFSDVIPEQFLGLVLPGGKSPERVRLEQEAISIVNSFLKRGAPIGAICHGPQILISARAVAGRRMTCWKGVRDDLLAAGAYYIDSKVVVDGPLVTSRMPSDLPDFMNEFLKVLTSATEVAKATMNSS
jgi:protease I